MRLFRWIPGTGAWLAARAERALRCAIKRLASSSDLTRHTHGGFSRLLRDALPDDFPQSGYRSVIPRVFPPIEDHPWLVRRRVYEAVAGALDDDVEQQFDELQSADPEHPYSNPEGLVNWWLSNVAETPGEVLDVLRRARGDGANT
jgi:hypothetical protein